MNEFLECFEGDFRASLTEKSEDWDGLWGLKVLVDDFEELRELVDAELSILALIEVSEDLSDLEIVALDNSLEFGNNLLATFLLRVEFAVLLRSMGERFVELLERHWSIAILIELLEDWKNLVIFHSWRHNFDKFEELAHIESAFSILIEILEDLL